MFVKSLITKKFFGLYGLLYPFRSIFSNLVKGFSQVLRWKFLAYAPFLFLRNNISRCTWITRITSCKSHIDLKS